MEGFCRGCLIKYDDPTDLIPYSEKNRRLFVYSTGLQVKRNDTFTFQLCKDCYMNMKESCKFKKVCRTSEKKFKNYISLKEGDILDFCTYLKNNDDSLMLKLPAFTSGNSTPAHHKNKDDDNESTCTSIRNFMSDILEGEEVPDTEARIIKELFEEEADVLDDSLDSHWLQDEDDMSIATDFRMDFSFSAFSTPRSINNDHCYTPRRINDEKYTDKPNKYHNMPLLEVDECAMDLDHVADIPMDNIPNNIYTKNQGNNHVTDENHGVNNLTVKNIDLFSKDKEIDLGVILEKGSSNLLTNKDINTEVYGTNHEVSLSIENHSLFSKNKESDLGISLDKDNNLLLNKHFNMLNENQFIQIEEIVEDDAIFVKDLLNIEDSTQQFVAPTEIENDFLKMADEHVKKEIDESIIKDELDYYINKVDEKRKNNENNKCSIDRNLEIALLNDQNREFSLEQLISSPRVSINSGASTPTIRNILFGNQTPKNFNLDNHGYHNNLLEVIIKVEEIKEEILDTNVDKIDITTENSVDDIINLIKEETYENHEHIQKRNTEIKTEDIAELIEDYVTNVYENTDNNTLDSNEIDNLLATVIPDLEDPKTPKNAKGIDTDLFKKPIPPDEQYDLENALCKICDKKFNLELALRVHFSRIHKVKIKPRKREYHTEMCTQCGKIYKGKASLIRHTKEAHSDPKEKHACKDCYMEFKTKYALNQHRRSHKDFEPKKNNGKKLCTFCGKYLNITNHKLHQLKHQNIYEFNCELCTQKFTRQWELDRHMRKHTKEKPFKCELCKNAYTRRNTLKNHLQMHLLGYRYECNECSNRFITKNALKKHFTKSLCPSQISKQKIKVTTKNIVLTPLKKHVKLTDVNIIKSSNKLMKTRGDKSIDQTDDEKMIPMYSDSKSKQIRDEPMITGFVQINDKNSTHSKQKKGTDNKPVKSDDGPMKRNDDTEKQTFRSDDTPMNKNDDKQMINTEHSMDNDKSMKFTDVIVKIEQITIDIE